MKGMCMSHWAEINQNNIVLRVLVGDNNDPNGDEGYQWLVDNLGGKWIKTSYNAIGGKRKNPETNELTNEPDFRKNYAGIGYYWDGIGFAAPQPHPSWIKNLDTYLWEPPVAYPTDGKFYDWDETTISWVEIVTE